MTRVFIVLVSIFSLSCNSNSEHIKTGPLRQWVLDNQKHLENDIESIIKNDSMTNNPNSNWISSGIVTTIYASNSLGTLAKIAGDSTECILVELTFYKDKKRKREIMIAAEDSSCLGKLNIIQLKTDSIGNLIFGKRTQPLYTKEGNPL